MAKQELDRHMELVKQLGRDREMLASLEAAASSRVQLLSGASSRW